MLDLLSRPTVCCKPTSPLHQSPQLAVTASSFWCSQARHLKRTYLLGCLPCTHFFMLAGHNIEAAWLLADGVDELQARGAIDSSKAAAARKALQEIGEAAIAAGYDNKNGGL